MIRHSKLKPTRLAAVRSAGLRQATASAALVLLAGGLIGCRGPMQDSPHEHSYKPGWQDTSAHRWAAESQPLTGIRGQNSPDEVTTAAAAGPHPSGTAGITISEAEQVASGVASTRGDSIRNLTAGPSVNHSINHSVLPAAGTNQPRRGDEGEGADGIARVSFTSRATPSGSVASAGYPTPGLLPQGFGPQGLATIQRASFSSAEPRLRCDDNGVPIHDPAPGGIHGAAAEMYPDEYLLDGGDRDLPVHYSEFRREGLETEDTVTEYVDHLGKAHVKPSNSVAIYAPRFGAVRAVTTPSGDTAIAKVGGLHDSMHDSGVKHRLGPDDYTKTQQVIGVRTRTRASGVENRDIQSGTFNIARLNSHTLLQNVFEDRAHAYQLQFDTTNEARMAYGIDAARQWTRAENPVVTAQLESLHQVEARFTGAEIVGTEDPRKEPGRLRIVKLADRSVAQPGDVVTFTIRYDNLGEREVNNVKIVDNLTPRLEYIEDTATSDRPGDIVTQENTEGSLVLTFKLDDPLKEKTGGVISFQCRVR